VIKRLSFSLFLILAMASSLDAVQGVEWVQVAPAGGGFSVMMPGKPKEETKADREYSSHSFSVMTDISVYLVEIGNYAPHVNIDPATELAGNRDNFVKGIEGKLIESKEIVLDGHLGLEFSAENSHSLARCRVYVSGKRVYMLVAGVSKKQDDSANVNRFLTSFAFTAS
jgi:hypothetical protein